ncbi:MAG: hypothetical protein ACRCZI_04835, partial [Cetobacterium sp.]
MAKLKETRANDKKKMSPAEKNLSKENEKLKEQLRVTKMELQRNAYRKTHNKSEPTEEEKSWALRILKNIKSYLWPKELFINTDVKLHRATVLLMKYMGGPEVGANATDKERADAEERWVKSYSDIVRKQYNVQRNYVQGQLRDLMVKHLMADEVPVVGVEEIEKIVQRDEDFLASEDGKKAFEFYHDEILKCVACKEHWDNKFRQHNTISEARHDYDSVLGKKTLCIPPKFEGFVLILFKNCYAKWMFIAEQKKANGINHRCDPKDDRMKTQYTLAHGGQQEWGGWTKEGRNLAKKYAEENKLARKNSWSKAAEKEILQRIRIKNKLEGAEAKLTKKRRRKRSQDDEDESDGDDLL